MTTEDVLETWEWKWIVLPQDSSLPLQSGVPSAGYVVHRKHATTARLDSAEQSQVGTASFNKSLKQHSNSVITETEHPPERNHTVVFVVVGIVAGLVVMYLIRKKNMGKSVLDGTDLILSVGGKALGFSTGCKVTTQTETGERVTKEAQSGKWKEKYVKSFSESISADGCVLTDGDSDTPTYDQLKDLQLAGKPIKASYNLRDGSERTGKTTGGYEGNYIITSLDLDAQAGDDAKYSVQLENSGAVSKVTDGNGLSDKSPGVPA